MTVDRKVEPLTPDEEVTLRRVAFGQSEVRSMRAKDLMQLRRLRLIEDSKDGPRLTVSGRQRFDELPKPTLHEKRPRDLMSAMTKAPRD